MKYKKMADKFFNDLKVGEVYVSGTKKIKLDEVIAFATEFDPQPMHTDVEAAKEGFFGELIGSGWQTLSTTIRLMVDSKPFGETPLIGMQVDEVRFLSPLRPGATLQAFMEIIELQASKKPGRGYVLVKVTTKADDKEILTQKWRMLIPRK
ncbi:MAG: acyl dehydratase [Alphaproteobacteria bacterium]|jgi:acyl dehydratase